MVIMQLAVPVAADRFSNPLHVLVVDDYAPNAESIAILLRLYGYHVETALNGSAALDLVEACVPDVVFVNTSTREMAAYDVARQLRGKLHERVVLIAFTADEVEGDKQCCYESGFDQYLTRPSTPVDLEHFLLELAALRRNI